MTASLASVAWRAQRRISLFALLATGGLGDLRLPVACYALAISAMLWRALARLGVGLDRQSALLAAGSARRSW